MRPGIVASILVGVAATSSRHPAIITALGPASFSWDTLPVAFHGANATGDYNEASIAQLAKYNMVTIEKWQGPCGWTHAPHAMRTDCHQEEVIARTLRAIRVVSAKANKTQALNMYLNSDFAFPFYDLTTAVEKIDGFMRDKDGKICLLNNDGNFYLDSPFYNWSNPEVQQLFQDSMGKWVHSGVADGFFADKASQRVGLNATTGKWTMCNGGYGKVSSEGRRCCEFTEAQALAINVGHVAALRNTQQSLGWKGLLINHAVQVPVSTENSTIWGDLVNLPVPSRHPNSGHLALDSRFGLAVEVRVASSGYGPAVKTGLCHENGIMDQNALASFLVQAQDNQYWTCFVTQGGATNIDDPTDVQTALPPWFPEYDYPLGAPKSDAVLDKGRGVLTREFASGTLATFDIKTSKGSVKWASEKIRYV